MPADPTEMAQDAANERAWRRSGDFAANAHNGRDDRSKNSAAAADDRLAIPAMPRVQDIRPVQFQPWGVDTNHGIVVHPSGCEICGGYRDHLALAKFRHVRSFIGAREECKRHMVNSEIKDTWKIGYEAGYGDAVREHPQHDDPAVLEEFARLHEETRIRDSQIERLRNANSALRNFLRVHSDLMESDDVLEDFDPLVDDPAPPSQAQLVREVAALRDARRESDHYRDLMEQSIATGTAGTMAHRTPGQDGEIAMDEDGCGRRHTGKPPTTAPPHRGCSPSSAAPSHGLRYRSPSPCQCRRHGPSGVSYQGDRSRLGGDHRRLRSVSPRNDYHRTHPEHHRS